MPAPTPSSFDVYPWLSNASRPGGTMDGPDLQTRAAALKLQAGIAPTPKEMMRLAGRQALEAGTGNGSYAPSDPRSYMVPNPTLGAGPTGAIDVNAYQGSRYNPANMMRPGATAAPAADGFNAPAMMRERTADTLLRSRFGAPPNERGQIDIAGADGTRSVPARPQDLMRPAAPTGPATPPPQAMMTAPGAGLPTPPRNSVYSMTQGTRLDPANIVLQAEERYLKTRAADTANASAVQMMQQSAETHSATMQDRTTEQGALRTATSPQAGTAQQIMAGKSFAELDPNATPDRSLLYMQQGGRSPAVAGALSREEAFNPTEIMLPGGTRLIKNSPRSVIPDPQQVRPATPKAPGPDTGPQLVKIGPKSYIYHAASKRYFDAETGQPVAFPDATMSAAMDKFGGVPASTGEPKPATPGKPADLPTVTPVEAAKLPKGTRFKTSDGRILTKQ